MRSRLGTLRKACRILDSQSPDRAWLPTGRRPAGTLSARKHEAQLQIRTQEHQTKGSGQRGGVMEPHRQPDLSSRAILTGGQRPCQRLWGQVQPPWWRPTVLPVATRHSSVEETQASLLGPIPLRIQCQDDSSQRLLIECRPHVPTEVGKRTWLTHGTCWVCPRPEGLPLQQLPLEPRPAPRDNRDWILGTMWSVRCTVPPSPTLCRNTPIRPLPKLVVISSTPLHLTSSARSSPAGRWATYQNSAFLGQSMTERREVVEK